MTLGLQDMPAVAKRAQETTLRADAETARAARMAASGRGVTIAEYLREVLLPVATRDARAAASELTSRPPSPPRRRKAEG